jgi:imidazolonepropionase-like amidohydrolase
MTVLREILEPAGPRRHGDGPLSRIVFRSVTIIDGTGAPGFGPVDVEVAEGRIRSIVAFGANTAGRFQPANRPAVEPETREVDGTGLFLLPGLVDAHAHIGAANKVPSAEYVYELWLGHGITTIREPGCFWNGLDFVLGETARSEASEIAAPRIVPYVFFGQGREEEGFKTPAEAVGWVEMVAEKGAKGIKFGGFRPEIFKAAMEAASSLGLGSACHHSQQEVARANALDTARWGLGSIEHWYGIPEALLAVGTVQSFPPGFNYMDERARFTSAGELWAQTVPPGSERWNGVIEKMVELGVALDPTFSVYSTLRDVMRARNADWHAEYTAPSVLRYWEPSPERHGSGFEDWTTELEVSWRDNMRRWMDFVADFHQRGGRVIAGSDAGSSYHLYGFGLIEELELLREAGLHPLEVIRAATLNGAELCGLGDEIGSVEVGKRADLLLVSGDPTRNLKVLYGTDAGVEWVLRGDILYSGPELRLAVREIVASQTR